MPSVSKQRVKKKGVKNTSPKPTGSKIQSAKLRPIGFVKKGIKINVYGRGKTGKTRFAWTFPGPKLLVGTEDGTSSLPPRGDPGDNFYRLDSTSDIGEVCSLAKDYRTIILDQASGLQDICLKEILGLEDVPIQKSWGIAQRLDWGTLAIQMKERLKQLIDLADTYEDTNVVIIAHERNFGDDEGSELITPTVGSSLTPSVCNWLNGACDYICQTFIRAKTKIEKTEIAGQMIEEEIPIGGAEYCLRVGPNPTYMTGFRMPPSMDDKLPEYVVNPTYAKIAEYLKG